MQGENNSYPVRRRNHFLHSIRIHNYYKNNSYTTKIYSMTKIQYMVLYQVKKTGRKKEKCKKFVIKMNIRKNEKLDLA